MLDIVRWLGTELEIHGRNLVDQAAFLGFGHVFATKDLVIERRRADAID